MACLWKCVESGKCWISAVISLSLNISVSYLCIVFEYYRGDCHTVYINWPFGHVKMTGATFQGEQYHIHTMFYPARTMQGDRCDLTWLRADHGHCCHCCWDHSWISVPVLSWGENTSSLYSRNAPHHRQGRTALRHDTKTHHVISQNKLQL